MTAIDAKEHQDKICEKHGKYVSQHIQLGKVCDFWSRCSECEAGKKREEEAAWKRQQREEWIVRLVKDAQIPVRFQGKTFSDYIATNESQRRALSAATDCCERFTDHLAAGRCMVFSGRPGTGKTMLGCCIAQSIARSGHAALYITVTELVRWLRSSWGGAAGDSESTVLRKLADLALLVVDEVGVQFGSDAELAQLTEVIDLRYRRMRPTLVISNCAPEELARYLGARGVDRLRENGGKVVIFDWPSHRGGT